MNNLLAQNTVVNLAPTGSFASLSGINFGSIISGAIMLILILAGLLFFFMLIIGGIRWR